MQTASEETSGLNADSKHAPKNEVSNLKSHSPTASLGPERSEEKELVPPSSLCAGEPYPVIPLGSLLDDVSRLVGICTASPRIKQLIIQQAHGAKEISAPFSVMLLSPTGRFKSTIMNAVADKLNEHSRRREQIKVITDASLAGLVGSIDKNTSQFVPGAAWNAAGRVLLLDEFRTSKHDDRWSSLLQIMDSGLGRQRYVRKLGVFCNPLHLRKGDLRLDVEGGEIAMDVRLSCLIASMKSVEYAQGILFRALMNRLVPYRYDLSEDDIFRFIDGDVEFNITEYNPEVKVTIPRREYQRIIRFVRDLMKVHPASSFSKKANLARSVEDLCRMRAVTGEDDIDFEGKIVGWRLSTYERIGVRYRKKG
jgi:hypothetical protein